MSRGRGNKNFYPLTDSAPAITFYCITNEEPAMANKNLSDTPRPSVHVPAGRTLADMPRGEPIPAPDGKPKPRNAKQTLRQLITHEENVNEEATHPFIKLLLTNGTEKKKGPWKEYLAFYRANMSGDMSSIDDKTQLYVEKMAHDLEAAYNSALKADRE